MAGKRQSFTKLLAEDMKDLSYAKGMFLFELEEFQESVKDVLISVVRKMDKAWFAELVGEQVDAVNSFVSGKRKLTNDEMNRYLAVLGLKQTGTHTVDEIQDNTTASNKVVGTVVQLPANHTSAKEALEKAARYLHTNPDGKKDRNLEKKYKA